MHEFLLILGLLAATAAPVAAQSLPELMAAARDHDLGLAVTRAESGQRAAEVGLAGAGLDPSLTVSGGYTRNQTETVVQLPGEAGMPGQRATIVPFDQLQAGVTLAVPLLDLGARRQVRAAAAARDAALATVDAVAAETDRAVVRAYFGWVGGTALVVSARAAGRTAADNLAVVEQRVAAELASRLDVARAQAAIAEARQAQAAAELVVATARRQLATLTGLELAGDAPALPEATDAEAALATWLGALPRSPEVRAAQAQQRAAVAGVAAARAGWLPVLGLTASEGWSNAAGFGESLVGSIGVSASWRLDLRTPRQVAVARAEVAVAAARAARAAQDARDRVTDAWNTVVAQRATVEAAVARTEAADEAASVAATRFGAGNATQLEVVQAQRDALAAQVTLVQARAELAAGRALLRLAAGREVTP